MSVAIAATIPVEILHLDMIEFICMIQIGGV